MTVPYTLFIKHRTKNKGFLFNSIFNSFLHYKFLIRLIIYLKATNKQNFFYNHFKYLSLLSLE